MCDLWVMIDIKDISGLTKFSTGINTGAKGKFTLMKEDYIVLPFSVQEPVYFKLGDYVDLAGVLDDSLGGKLAKIYELVDLYQPTYNQQTGGYDYKLKLDADYMKWKNKKFKFTPEHGGQEASWSLTATLDVHLDVFLRNLVALGYKNRGNAYTYSIDSTVISASKLITYDNTNMIDALTLMAETFGCEWWVDSSVIHFGRCEFGDAVELEIGKEIASMSRSNSKGTFATRVYAFGSTRNIPENYREVDESMVVNGVVQKRLMLPEGTPYIDAYPDMETEEAVEAIVVFDDIYPHRIGTMSNVTAFERTEDVEGEDGETTQETYTVYRYKDTDLNFSSEYFLPGQELRVTFQSGSLMGMDFGVIFNPDEKSPEEQLWEIVRNEDYGVMLPNDTLKPKNGDTYILYGYDIKMVSDTLIPEAEQELKERAEDFVERSKVDDGTYTATLDSDWVYDDTINRTFGLGQRVNLKNPAYFENGRVSRILGFEFYLDFPHDSQVYTIGESTAYSRFGEIEDKLNGVSFGGQSYVGVGGGSGSGGGGSVYIIRTNDSTPASDSNVFSALRSLSTFLRKDRADSTRYLLSLLGGAITDNLQSQAFAAGPFGTGYLLKRDPSTGKSYMEIDELYVRLKAYFDTLEIKHLSHVGGRIVLSPAAMECNRVEIVDANYEPLYDSEGSQIYDSLNDEVMVPVGGGEQAYRCYFKQTDGEKEIVNEFAVDDLVQCREFNVKENISHNVSNQYYWRRVINVGDDYIDLSMDDCDTGSMEPKAGDTIVTIGNKTDVNRQHVVFLSSYDDDAPCIKLYSGINSYSMLNKEVTVISPNADKNVFTGKVVIKPGSTGFKDLSDAPDMDEIEREIQEAKDDAISANQAISNVQQSVADLQGYVTGAFSDGIISEAEAKAIEKYINVVRNEQRSTTSTYNQLEDNPYLEGSALVGLTNAKSALDSAITSLINAINTAIADGRTTTEEKNAVDVRYSTFNTKCAEFYSAVSAANQSIQDKLKGYSDEAQKAADKANKAVSALTSDLNELDNTVSELDRYVDVSFADGIITAIEAASIEKYINVVNNQKASAEATYNQLYNNEYLPSATKTLLSNTKSELFSVIDTLVNNINAAIRDDKTTAAEKSAVDYWFNSYNDKCEAFAQAVETANEAIQGNLLNLAAASSNQKIQEALRGVTQQFAAINASLQTVKGDVNDLDTYLDAATEDGIITQIEAAAIGKYTNTINQTKKAMDATYTSLYSNQYLLGTYKSALYSAKISFNTAVTNLLSSINSAISDNKTTKSEMNTVNSRFNTFNTAYASLATAIENANKSIQAQLRAQIEAGVSKDIETAVGKVPAEVKDDFAKKLGYDDYDELVYYAERGQTVVTGGHINTDLIETSLLITSQLIAEAIKANTLNVNDKFKVYTDGSVDMNGSVTSEDGDNRSTLSNGFFRLMRKRTSAFYEILRIAANNDDAEIFMKSSSGGVRYLSITPSGLTFDYVDTLTGGRINLTLDPTVIGKGMTNAIIKKTSDGMLYVSDDGEDKYKFTINVSGEGTTSPSPGTSYVTSGKIIYLHAYPDDGYEFNRWSDGGAQSHQISVNRDNYSITAYFTKKASTTKYTLTLNRNPSNGGTVSGGGTYNAGTSVRVSASPNSGWRFVRWSDGMGQTHSVTMNANKSLTAYFEKYTVTGDEIFSGTALTSSTYWKTGGGATVSVSSGIATIRFKGSQDFDDDVYFNRGYLGSKIEQGHRYLLTLELKSTKSNTVLVADLCDRDGTDPNYSTLTEAGGALIYGDALGDHLVGTSYKTITAEFTARRDSTVSDCLWILAVEALTLSIRKISLKEV